MHVSGPVRGQPYFLGLIGASPSAVALDTAVFSLLGQTAADVPTWGEAVRRRLPGAHQEDIWYPLDPPQAFDATGFQVPRELDPVRFNPARLAKSSLKHLWAAVSGRK